MSNELVRRVGSGKKVAGLLMLCRLSTGGYGSSDEAMARVRVKSISLENGASAIIEPVDGVGEMSIPISALYDDNPQERAKEAELKKKRKAAWAMKQAVASVCGARQQKLETLKLFDKMDPKHKKALVVECYEQGLIASEDESLLRKLRAVAVVEKLLPAICKLENGLVLCDTI